MSEKVPFAWYPSVQVLEAQLLFTVRLCVLRSAHGRLKDGDFVLERRQNLVLTGEEALQK